ncbi:MAG: hypothetical protein LUP95_07580 [Euryarchaeota archaeon]|nr:hypothetical protein [Euryarchaeota archaeon]
MDSRKITAALAIAALMTLAVVTAGCTTTTSPSPTPTPVVQTTTAVGNNTTLTSTAGFKVTFPSKFKFDQNGSTPVKLYVYLDPTNNVTALNVATEKLQSNATLDSVSDDYLSRLINYQNFTTIQKVTNGTLAGKPARTLAYQAVIPVQYSPTDVRNQTLQVQTIWTMNNGTSYVLTYKTPPSNFSKFVPDAQNIVNSFQLT